MEYELIANNNANYLNDLCAKFTLKSQI